MRKKRTKTVTLEQVYAGSLLAFDEVDDFLLNKIFVLLKKEGIKVEEPLCYRYKRLNGFIRPIRHSGNGHSVALAKNTSLEKLDDVERKTVKESLKDIAGPALTEFFTQTTKELLEKRFQVEVDKMRGKLLADARVLLISDREEDYRAFVSYGFKKISFFKSLYCADRYFEKNPGELSNFQIYVLGNNISRAEEVDDETNLEKRIREFEREVRILVARLYDYGSMDTTRFMVFLNDYRTWKSLVVERKTYGDLLSTLVDATKFNNVLSSIDEHKKDLPLPNSTETPEKLPLPRSQKDIKILCLPTSSVPAGANEMASSLGLDVTFLSDNNYTYRSILERLGDYDIIIGSEMYSSKIPYSSVEAIEQCKITGRRLTLLASYDTSSMTLSTPDGRDKAIGLKVTLRYSHGGLDFTDSKDPRDRIEETEFAVPHIKYTSDEDYYDETKNLGLRTILEAVVSLYDKKLDELGEPLADCTINPYEEYTDEYRMIREEELEHLKRINRELEFKRSIAHKIDSITEYTIAYLKLFKNGRAPKLKDISINETQKGIRIKISSNGQFLSAITISKKDTAKDARVFALETINKKGKLASPVTLSISPSFESSTSSRTPDEKETNIVVSIEKKLATDIGPLIQKLSARSPRNGRCLQPVGKKS